jgi:hypothetical protein
MRQLLAQSLRYFRIILGVMVIMEGYYGHTPLLYLLGGMLVMMGILNIGCGFGTCGVPGKKEYAQKNYDPNEVAYEEVGKK